MELIRTIREKSQTRRQHEVHRMAVETITLSDFDGKLYIAYQGNPLILIDDSLTAKEALENLSVARNNFITAKLKNLC